MPDEITLDEYRALVNRPAKAPQRHGERRKKQTVPAAHPALTAGPGSSFQARLDKAARNGWHAIESGDALRYRWRTNGGAVGPWLDYEGATKWGATHKPGEATE